MNAKSFASSKTLIWQVLFVLVAVASQAGFAEFKPSSELEQVGLAIWVLGNIIVRFLTKQPITLGR